MKCLEKSLENIDTNVRIIVKKSSPKNLSADCWSTVGRQVTDSLPTANQQVTDRLRKKKNCVYDSTDFTYLPIDGKV